MGNLRDLQTELSVAEQLSDRSRDVFREIVEAYVETGAPIGSRTLSRQLGLGLSPATIRNVMADLEEFGLLMAPHTSAGRLPTELGLRLYVRGLLEHGNISEQERRHIEERFAGSAQNFPDMLEEASQLLSGLSRCAGLVTAAKNEGPLKHIEFVALGPGRALVVLVTQSGQVENRVIDVPLGLPPSSLVEAGNFLANRLSGRPLNEAKQEILKELTAHKAELDELTTRVVEAGLATWTDTGGGGALIVRGQAQLLEDINALEDLERIRHLFSTLESKEAMLKLMELTDTAEGVQIFIGSENELFGLSGCSVVIAPYNDSSGGVVGALGVIGPTRIDYARIIPMVDYTAKVLGRMAEQVHGPARLRQETK